MTERKVLIAGQGRCGTSLTMQMLNVFGLRLPGKFPFFEEETGKDWAKIDKLDALKWLGPGPEAFPPIPGYEYHVVWLKRDPKEQAASRLKFERELGKFLDKSTFATQEKIRKRIPKAEAQGLAQMEKIAANEIPIIFFEDILAAPKAYAAFLWEFVMCLFRLPLVDLDLHKAEAWRTKGIGYIDRAAALVYSRSPKNYAGFLEKEMENGKKAPSAA